MGVNRDWILQQELKKLKYLGAYPLSDELISEIVHTVKQCGYVRTKMAWELKGDKKVYEGVICLG